MKELIHVSHLDFKLTQVEKSVIPGETSGGWTWCNTLVLKTHRVFLEKKENLCDNSDSFLQHWKTISFCMSFL